MVKMENKDINVPDKSLLVPDEPSTTSTSNSLAHLKRQLTPTESLPLYGQSDSVPNSPIFIRNLRTATLVKNSPQLNTVLNVDNLPAPPSPTPSLKINRPVYNVMEFNKNYIPNETQKTTKEKFRRFKPDFSKRAWMNRLKRYIPITLWLPQYSIKQNLIADIIVGITIASFQVPQSMGYALIAHVNPIFGLYTAFFPALMYTIFGTSRHSSVGPVAIVAGLMTGNIVIEVMTELNLDYRVGSPLSGNNTSGVPIGYEGITNVDIAIMVGLINGIYIFVLGCLRLGFISNYLSDELVSGFMTSAALYVFTTQVHYLFGVELTNFNGPLALINTYIEFFERIREVNLTAFIISLICMAILLFFKLFIEKLFAKLGLKMPFPIHLFIIIGGCIASYLLDLNVKYNVDIVGNIPNQFQLPSAPKFILFKYMWHRCIPTAVVAYTITLSVGRLYGSKHNYVVDPNQEMLALGISNIWASFFSTLCSSASIPRSAVQESGGGKTQIVSLVNCVCIVFVILVLSTLLNDLPKCVLASCIAVALVSIISKFQEFINFWRISKLDGGIWMITFLGVVILNVDYGIYIGFGCSLLLLIYKSQRPKTYSLGSVDNSDIYVPLSKFKRAVELEGVKIYQFCGPLNFANVLYFKKELQIRSGVDVTAIKEEMQSLNPNTNCFIFGERRRNSDEIVLENKDLPKFIIIDCSMLSYIDTSGVTTLKKLVQSHSDINIQIELAGCPVHIETMLKKDGFFKEVSSDRVFKSVHDAVTYIRDTEPNIGIPVEHRKQNNNNFLPKILSNLSLDSLDSHNISFKNCVNSDMTTVRTPDSPKSILKESPINSPQLTRVKVTRSVTFSYP